MRQLIFGQNVRKKLRGKYGNEIFDGDRNNIHWLNGFVRWYAKQNKVSCDPSGSKPEAKMKPCSNKFQIDHKRSFYAHLEMVCVKRKVCDGQRHWEAFIARFKDEDLSFPITLRSKKETSVVRICHDSKNLRWMCSRHNPSKGGKRNPDDLYMPDDLGPCPAADGESKCAL